MKFTNGYWCYRDGVQCYGALETRSVCVESNRVIVYVSPIKVFNRGQTLSGPLLTLEFTSPHEDVIGVWAYHFKGAKNQSPYFQISDYRRPLEVTQDEKEVHIISGKIRAQIKKDPFEISYYYEDKLLTRSGTKQLAYILAGNEPFFRERLNIGVGECIYGLGERFTAFVKNGQSVDVWNEDGGTASEQAYKNIPFYVSNRGYGVFVNHPEKVSFEIGSEAVSKAQFSVSGEGLNYYVIGGGSLKQVVSNYTDMTGKPSLPPAWSFGLWLSTSFTTEYNEDTITHFVNGMRERDIPLSVFHFDCFWMKEYEWCNFEWDAGQFSDVEGMLSRLRAGGLKICVWINPYIGQKSRLFDEGMLNGYLLKNKNGDVWQWDMWQPGMALVDFTNPQAVDWYKGYLRKLLEQGVDCFKTDFGERIPLDVCYYDGSDPYKMHNYYTYLYNKAVFELLQEYKGKNEAVLFARSATAGSQAFPVHWGGDCDATYESMAESLRGGLSLSLGGFGFWSHDIGGFESTAPADVYKRWVAFGLFSSHSRLHGSSSYRVPWLFDEESVDVLRYFSKLKAKLMPYLYAFACEAAETGMPLMRPMVLEYPDDTACAYLDRQYMLGDSILVGPVFELDGTAEVYLPQGRFTHLLTNEAINGGQFIKRRYDYFGLHVWVKPNTIIAMGAEDNGFGYDYAVNLDVHIYALEGCAETNIYTNNGKLAGKIAATMDSGTVKVSIEGDCAAKTISVHNNGQSRVVETEKDCRVYHL